MKKLLVLLTMILFPSVCFSSTYWASPTGTKTNVSQCSSSSPLSGTDCCTIATVGAGAVAGDTVYLRGGTYDCHLYVTHSGTCDPDGSITDSCRITFKGYQPDIDAANPPVISNSTCTFATYLYGIVLKYIDWVVIDGINVSVPSTGYGAIIMAEGAQYNEIKNCTIDGNERLAAIAWYSSGTDKSIHNWIHDNTIREMTTINWSEFRTNSGMENDSDWTSYGSPTTQERSSEQAYAGTYSRKVVIDSAGDGLKSPTFTSTATGYSYGISVYPITSTSIDVISYKGNGTDIMCQTTESVTPGQWNRVTGSCTYTAGNTGSGSYVAVASPTGVTEGTYYIDTFDYVNCNDGSGFQIGSTSTTMYYEDNNTIEDNYIPYAAHFTLELFSRYNVVRNNVFHNEGWATKTYECDVCAYGCDSNGKYGNRNISLYHPGQYGYNWDNFSTSCSGVAALSSVGTPTESAVTNTQKYDLYCSQKVTVDAAGEGITTSSFATPPIKSGTTTDMFYEFAVYPNVTSIGVNMYAGDGSTLLCSDTKTVTSGQWNVVAGACNYASANAGSSAKLEIVSPVGVTSATYYIDYLSVADGGWELFEGNRVGYAGASTDDDGSDNINFTSWFTLFRNNYVFGAANNNILMKSGVYGGANRGSNNSIYNNTIYYAGRYKYSPGFWQGYNLRWYGSYMYVGNMIKNNIIYGYGPDGTGDFSSDAYAAYNDITYNWCTSADTASQCSGNGNPNFDNTDMSDMTSQVYPTLRETSGSPTINSGTHLANADGAGTGSTSLILKTTAKNRWPATAFQDGTWGSKLSRLSTGLGGTLQADWIAIGTVDNVVQISSIDYTTNTITLAESKTWADNANIWLYKKSDGTVVLYGSAPDQGAYEFQETVTNANFRNAQFGVNVGMQ